MRPYDRNKFIGQQGVSMSSVKSSQKSIGSDRTSRLQDFY